MSDQPSNRTTPEQAAYERGFRDGWDARGKNNSPAMPSYGVMQSCSVCGISFDRAMGYCCSNMSCPFMPKMLATRTMANG